MAILMGSILPDVVAERDRYRAALVAITKVGHGNSWAYEDDPWEWIDAVEKIVADALVPSKE